MIGFGTPIRSECVFDLAAAAGLIFFLNTPALTKKTEDAALACKKEIRTTLAPTAAFASTFFWLPVANASRFPCWHCFFVRCVSCMSLESAFHPTGQEFPEKNSGFNFGPKMAQK